MKTLEELRQICQKAQNDLKMRTSNYQYKVVVGMGTSGIARGDREVMKTFLDKIAARNLNDILVSQTGEKGLSSLEPVVDVMEEGKSTVTYGNLNPEKARCIITEHLVNNHIVNDYVVTTKD